MGTVKETDNKPWWKKIPWYGWSGIVGVLLVAGIVQSGTTDSTQQPVATPVDENTSEPVESDSALPSGEDLATYVSSGLENTDLNEACSQNIKWACNVTKIIASSPEHVTVEVTEPGEGVQPAGVAMSFRNFISEPLPDGSTTLMPELLKVTVIDTSGLVLAETSN